MYIMTTLNSNQCNIRGLVQISFLFCLVFTVGCCHVTQIIIVEVMNCGFVTYEKVQVSVPRIGWLV